MENDLSFFNWNIAREFNNDEVTHIELPSNILQKYRYMNINNPSFYDLYLYVAEPKNGGFVQPFQKIPQNSLLSFEIPTEISHNGIFILPIFNNNNSVAYEKRAFIQFSQNNNGWNEIGKEINNTAIQFQILDENDLSFLNGKENDLMFDISGADPYDWNEYSILFARYLPICISFYVDDEDFIPNLILYADTDPLLQIHKGYNFLLTFGNTQNMSLNIQGGSLGETIKLKNFKLYTAQ